MTVETVIYTRLSTHVGLFDVVGARIYPNIMPQNVTFPAVSYNRVSAQRISAMGIDSGLVRARFQFDVWAATYAEVRAVTEQVRQALQRWRNNSGTVVQDSFFLNEIDLYEPETKTQHVALDFEIIYQE